MASVTGEESVHNISELSSIFGNIQSVMSHSQTPTEMDKSQMLIPIVMHQHVASPPTTQQQEHLQQPAQPQPPPAVIRAKAASVPTALAYNQSFS